MEQNIRKTGIGAVDVAPWGTHCSLFYDTQQDLFDILVPYFKAGLENNERCIWITSEPLSEKDAEEAMAKAIPDFSQYLASQQIEFIPHTEWYLKDGTYNQQIVLNAWIDKIGQALALGYDGMRATGDTAWLQRRDWSKLVEYEEAVNNAIGEYRMLAICTYPLHKYSASEIIDVERNHQFNLTKHEGKLVLIGSSEHKQVEEALMEDEAKYRTLLELSPYAIVTLDFKGVITSCNTAIQSLSGYSEDEIVGKHFSELPFFHPKYLPKYAKILNSLVRGKTPEPFEVAYHRKDGEPGWAEVHVGLINVHGTRAGIQVVTRDITERKQAEDKLRELEERFHVASQIASDVVYERDLQTGIATFYGDIDTHLGYDLGEYPRTLEGWREHVYPEDLARIENKTIDQMEPGVPYSIEYRMRKKDGTYMTWLDQVIMIRDEKTGKPLKFIGAATDITKQKQAEEKRRLIVETALDGFWVVSLEGRILEVNDSYCQMIGYTREKLLKMSVWDVEAVETPEDFARRMNKVVRQGYDRFETKHKRKDGKIIDVEINVNYLDLEEGQAFVSLRDITKQKQAEKRQAVTSRAGSKEPLTPLQDRFLKSGFKGFEDQQTIELLLSLFYSPRECSRQAKKAIKEFKNLRTFLTASPQQLERAGISPCGAFIIRLLQELPEEVLKQRIVEQPVYSSSKEVFDYLIYSMRDLKKEVFRVLYLNNRNQIISIADLFEGTLETIPIRPREIVESAIKHDATGLIFAHNHPAGDPKPSKSDRQLTRDLVFIGNIIQIKVLDHIIIGSDTYFSFAAEGLIQKYEDEFLNLKIRAMFDSGRDYLKNLAPVLLPLILLIGEAGASLGRFAPN